MKFIIFSDVHGNLEALHAALKFIEGYPDAMIYSLGDIVGYGANPRECISEIKKIAHASLAGNHEHAVIGSTSIEYFNPYAKAAVMWTADCLSEKDKMYLSGLPLIKKFQKKFFLVHSSPIDPSQWNYILSMDDARRNFKGFEAPLCFIGHSHSPMVIGLDPDGKLFLNRSERIQVETKYRYIINIGSIGQPRDGDWRACLVLYDDETQILEYKRLEYDLTTSQTKIHQAGLPDYLAERLSYGR
jgi:diadenosine tetraphosphatase ApaH/serine/threonine PP2A family protein phosphatase